jgi:signal peptidase I
VPAIVRNPNVAVPLGIIAGAVLLALLARTLVSVYVVPSSSMEPTLRPGDYLLAAPYHAWWRDASPADGDVVVFSTAEGRTVVKRLIAGPGELIEVSGPDVRVNGRLLTEPYARPGGSSVVLPLLIPAGTYFVMGDNRADSVDSRMIGAIPRRNITARVLCVLWPPRRI